MPCTVDPMNAQKAMCTCQVMRNTEEWMTLGGQCNTATCTTGYWSGALLNVFQQGVNFMMTAEKLTKSPVQWCPAGKSAPTK